MLTGASQESGIGVWVGAAELLLSSSRHEADSRQKFGQRWQPSQQLQQFNDDQISVFANNVTS
jgi:hypothetical protein